VWEADSIIPTDHVAQSVVTVVGAVTDRGLLRASNEDAIVANPPVFVVADGMGGHNSGALASAIVADQMQTLTRHTGYLTYDDVDEAIQTAARRVSALGNRRGRLAAGTTLTGTVIVEHQTRPHWLVFNLGDSRTYRYRDGELLQLTVDDSEVQELLTAGRISAEQAREHPRRHVVTKALGAGVDFTPAYQLLPVELGDRLLICSDGLTAELPNERIAQVLGSTVSAPDAASRLLDEALACGGHDNISAVVVDALAFA
jgi:protein phosphatase